MQIYINLLSHICNCYMTSIVNNNNLNTWVKMRVLAGSSLVIEYPTTRNIYIKFYTYTTASSYILLIYSIKTTVLNLIVTFQ